MHGEMHYREPGDRRTPSRPDVAELIAGFPGAVAIACDPPTGSTAHPGFENDGQPWSVQVLYAGPGDERLLVRTVRARGEGALPTMTVEDLGSWLRAYSRGAFGASPVGPDSLRDWQAWQAERMAAWGTVRTAIERAPRIAVSMLIDGEAVPGARVDLPDCSGVELDWDGRTVYCVGRPRVIDALRLRTATGEEFALFMGQRP